MFKSNHQSVYCLAIMNDVWVNICGREIFSRVSIFIDTIWSTPIVLKALNWEKIEDTGGMFDWSYFDNSKCSTPKDLKRTILALSNKIKRIFELTIVEHIACFETGSTFNIVILITHFNLVWLVSDLVCL